MQTVNDVVNGMLSAGFVRYFDRLYGNLSLIWHSESQFISIYLYNVTRNGTRGFHGIKDVPILPCI